MALGLMVGIASVGLFVYQKNMEMRRALMVQTRSIDLALDWSSMYASIQSVVSKDRAASGVQMNDDALAKNQAIALRDLTPYRERIEKICAVYPKCRAVYLMHQTANKKVIFLLDSSPPTSSLYLPPGTVYTEISPGLLEVFNNSEPLIEGPYTDRWGKWVSAFVPHTFSGKKMVVVGMDIEASDWDKSLRQAAIFPTIVTLVFLLVMSIYTWLWHTKNKQNDTLQQSQLQLLKLSHEDSLTGLPNRRLLENRLEKMIASSERGAEGFTVTYIDLDGFKHVNDTLGHDAGDQLLCLVAARLTNALREEDTVARLAGDEFVVILPRIETQVAAELVAEKIIKELAMPISIENSTIVVTASVGVIHYTEKLSTPQRLIKAADEAMYLAKKTGANRYYYSTALPKSDLD